MIIKVICKYTYEFKMDWIYGIDSVFPAKKNAFEYRHHLIWRYIGRGI